MTFIFFVLALLSAVLSLNVLRPLYRHPKWIVVSFLTGWLAGELALHVVAVQVLLMWLFAAGGAASGFWGGLALLLMMASSLVLCYHYFSGYKAGIVMDQIVVPHRRSSDLHAWTRHNELNISRLIRPFSSWKDEDVIVDKNVVYEEIDGFRLKLDIRRPCQQEDHDSPAPVLLQIHGGAWTYGYGSKNEQGIPLMVEMARRGWVAVAIDYRLSPHATMPDHLIDCKRALAWIKSHISEYGGNPDYIVVTGGSAGGHLSSLLALTPNMPEFQPGFERVDTRVQGCVPYYGIYDLLDRQRLQLSVGLEIILRKSIIKRRKEEDTELYERMSPLSHVNADAPPFLVVHGDKDSLTALGEAQYFASELDAASRQSVEFAEIPGAQHAFDVFSSLRSDYVMFGVAERIEQWYRDAKDAK